MGIKGVFWKFGTTICDKLESAVNVSQLVTLAAIIVVQNKNWLQRILHDEDETQIIVEAIADTMI